MSGFDWRTAAPSEVDHEYSPSQHAKRPLAEYLEEYVRFSAGVDTAELRTPGAPLFVYIHGGYWQQLSAAESLFNAADAHRRGVALHAVDYDLAPRVTLEEIVAQCIADVTATLDELRPPRAVLAGCSAGAHLAAMCAREPGIARRIDGVALLSGVYDLRPLIVTPTNDALSLDLSRAEVLSPVLSAPSATPPAALCAVGRYESGEFTRQNREYAEHLRSFGSRVTDVVVDGRDHFDLPYDLLSRGTVVGDWVLETLGVT